MQTYFLTKINIVSLLWIKLCKVTVISVPGQGIERGKRLNIFVCREHNLSDTVLTSRMMLILNMFRYYVNRKFEWNES